MAHMPSEIKVSVTVNELAEQLELLAQGHEVMANEIRRQAEQLRKGVDLTLNFTATQVKPNPTPEGEGDQGEGLPPHNHPFGATLTVPCPRCEIEKLDNLTGDTNE